MYWYDWHGPQYSLMKSRISVRPSKDFHTYIITNRTAESNVTTKANAKKKSQSVTQHNTKKKQKEFTQHNTEGVTENLGVEDNPPIKENKENEFYVTEYPAENPPNENVYDDYQTG